jgi:putative transposase
MVDRRIYDDDRHAQFITFSCYSLKIKELYRERFPSYWSTIEETDPAWQARYYPFNVFTVKKLEEKLDYMHLNPVRRGLVIRAVDWK